MKYSLSDFDEYGYPKGRRVKRSRETPEKVKARDDSEENGSKKSSKSNSGKHYTRRRRKHDR